MELIDREAAGQAAAAVRVVGETWGSESRESACGARASAKDGQELACGGPR
jgi:hypothetical protein